MRDVIPADIVRIFEIFRRVHNEVIAAHPEVKREGDFYGW